MKRFISLFLILLLVGVGGYYLYQYLQPQVEKDAIITVPAKRGEFLITVSATGELQAARSESIVGPQGMRSVGIFQTTITDIVAEGTLVEEGSYVATLDRTELGNKMKTVGTDIEKTESQLLQVRLDTAIEMRGLRDQLINLKYSIEEKKLEDKMNIYEPPAVRRQTQLELERLGRDISQAKQNYQLKQEQAQAKVKEITATLTQHQNQMKMMMDLSSEFVVKAPKGGMVIYDRGWNGKKGPGSRISGWDPVVAQLPDLSDMISVTYVNEVDISKVKVDQEVNISIDAFPDKNYIGKVFSIANIGEQRPNFDAKVFEVKIQLVESDSILRPAMTTANHITTSVYEDVISIPLEAIHSNDSLSYVFVRKEGSLQKQEVLVGLNNDQEVIIELGVEKNDEISLTIPNDADEIAVTLLGEDVKMNYKKKKVVQKPTPSSGAQPPTDTKKTTKGTRVEG